MLSLPSYSTATGVLRSVMRVGLSRDGGVGFGRSVSGEGGDGGQQQGEAQSQRAEIGVHTSAS